MERSFKLCVEQNSSPIMITKIEDFFNAISGMEGIEVNRTNFEITYDTSKEKILKKLLEEKLLDKNTN